MPWLCRVCSHSNPDDQKICMVCGDDKRPFSHSPTGKNIVAIVGVPVSLAVYAGAMIPVMHYIVRMFRVDELLPYCTAVGVMMMVMLMACLYSCILRKGHVFVLKILAYPLGLSALYVLLLTVPSMTVLWLVFSIVALVGGLTLFILRMIFLQKQHSVLMAGVTIANAMLIGMALLA